MRRRDFIFRSAKAAMFLSPVLSIRRAEAQAAQPMRAFFFVDAGSYPLPEDFFPAPTNTITTLSPILSGFESIKSDLLIIDGINIQDSGPNPKGNNHIRSVGKVLTAKDIIDGGETGSQPGGISIDQLISQHLGKPSIEGLVHSSERGDMRGRPFASGARQFKPSIANPAEIWDRLFLNFQPSIAAPSTDPAAAAAREQRIMLLTQRKSLLDDLIGEMARFRAELYGVEKLKLDIHEDAIRTAEKSIANDLKAMSQNSSSPAPSAQCKVPARDVSVDVPTRSKAHFDLIYAALLCNRIGVGGMMYGWSSINWRYEWINLGVEGNMHDDVYHKIGNQRAKHVRGAQWNFEQLALFAKRLKATPEGSSHMLNNVLIYATSFFGKHHELTRIPLILIGNAQGKLKTNRIVKVPSRAQGHAQVLTSVARLVGINAAGFGDHPTSGPLPEIA